MAVSVRVVVSVCGVFRVCISVHVHMCVYVSLGLCVSVWMSV